MPTCARQYIQFMADTEELNRSFTSGTAREFADEEFGYFSYNPR